MKTKHILIALAAIIIASSAALNVVISNRSSEKAISNMSVADLEAFSQQDEIELPEAEIIFYKGTTYYNTGDHKYPDVQKCTKITVTFALRNGVMTPIHIGTMNGTLLYCEEGRCIVKKDKEVVHKVYPALNKKRGLFVSISGFV